MGGGGAGVIFFFFDNEFVYGSKHLHVSCTYWNFNCSLRLLFIFSTLLNTPLFLFWAKYTHFKEITFLCFPCYRGLLYMDPPTQLF